MGTCELCGTDSVSTHQVIASEVNVDACNRCIEKMQLPLFESPFEKTPSSRRRTASTPIHKSHVNIMQGESNELFSDFHIRIRNAREARGWDQRQFAMRMNERLNAVQKVENGSRPTDALLSKIEKVLGIELYGEPTFQSDAVLIRSTDRKVTIADALDEFLSRGATDD